jgi:hypothetical protein
MVLATKIDKLSRHAEVLSKSPGDSCQSSRHLDSCGFSSSMSTSQVKCPLDVQLDMKVRIYGRAVNGNRKLTIWRQGGGMSPVNGAILF